MRTPSDLVLGIDPGTHRAGLCLLREGRFVNSTTLKAPSKQPAPARVPLLVRQLVGYMAAHCPSPGLVLAVENPIYMEHRASGGGFGYRRGTPIKELYLMVGALLAYGELSGHPVVLYPVPDIKLGVAGDRRASKEEVQGMLSLEFGLDGLDNGLGEPMDPEQWDALAVASYHWRVRKLAAMEIVGDPF